MPGADDFPPLRETATQTYMGPSGIFRTFKMAKKAAARKKTKAAKRAPATKNAAKPKGRALRTPEATIALVNAGVHDFTNLATAVRAYLELLQTQSKLEDTQRYYVDRAREQVEMMVDLMRELKEKLN